MHDKAVHSVFWFLVSKSQLNTLNSASSKIHLSVGVSSFSNDDVLMFRPYGGCAIFWPANLKASIHFIDTCNRRIFFIRLCNDDHKLLFINIYMPYESDNDAYNEYQAVLAEVISLTDLFPDRSLVIGGDFNVDWI